LESAGLEPAQGADAELKGRGVGGEIESALFPVGDFRIDDGDAARRLGLTASLGVIPEGDPFDFVVRAKEEVSGPIGDGRGIFDADCAGGQEDVFLDGESGGARKSPFGISRDQEEIVADDIIGGHMIMRGPAHAPGDVFLDAASLAAFIKVIG